MGHMIANISFIIGIIGNAAALYILTALKSRARKHILMLSCLTINDFVAEVGMLIVINVDRYGSLSKIWICRCYVLLRAFGLGSACISFVMAAERWLALTKPFSYHRIVTYHRLYRCLIIMWVLSAIWTYLPLAGFGLYYKKESCSKYRCAEKVQDKVYAYIFFVYGTTLLICIGWFNLSIVWKLSHMGSHRRTFIRRISKSSMSCKRIHCTSTSYHQTSEEISISKLMATLCITFFVCWAPQMISFPLAQFYEFKPEHPFFILSDLLMSVYFTLNPYIYVLYRYVEKGKITSACCCKKKSLNPQSTALTTVTITETPTSELPYSSSIQAQTAM